MVTGANRGIGFEVCRQLARSSDDMTVLLTTRNSAKGDEAVKQLKGKGLNVDFYRLDVSDKDDVKRIYQDVVNQFGRLDVLVNNAAILYDSWQSAIDADLDVVSKALSTNLYGPWLLCQIFVPLMKKMDMAVL